MAYIHLGQANVQERLRKLKNTRAIDTFDSNLALPVAVVNDGFVDQVNCASAESAATGTTTIMTTPSGRVETFVTALTLTISHFDLVGA